MSGAFEVEACHGTSIEIPLVGNIVLIDTEVIVMAKCFEAFFTTWNTSADHQVV